MTWIGSSSAFKSITYDIDCTEQKNQQPTNFIETGFFPVFLSLSVSVGLSELMFVDSKHC